MADYRALATGLSANAPCDFRKRMLVCTAPQFEHSNLWTARLRRVGWGSITAGISGWRHFGQVSFIKRSRDMMNSFSLWDTRRGHTAALTVLLAYAQAQAEGACPRRFSGFGRADRLFGVMAELICNRHRPNSAPEPTSECVPWPLPSV